MSRHNHGSVFLKLCVYGILVFLIKMNKWKECKYQIKSRALIDL